MWVIPPTRLLCRICGSGLLVIQRNHNMCSVFGHRYGGAHYAVPGSLFCKPDHRFQQWFLMMSCTALGSHIASNPGCRHLHGEGGGPGGVNSGWVVAPPALALLGKVMCLWCLSSCRQLSSHICICACPWHYHQQICARGPEVRLKYCWGFWESGLL